MKPNTRTYIPEVGMALATKTNHKNRLVYGKGIVDVTTPISKTGKDRGKRKTIWICPYYKKWTGILERCFSLALHKRHPSYSECKICDDWLRLSNFIKWVDSQPNKDWENCQPDKDLLITGNKYYSPETVVFVSKKVNCFLVDSQERRGKHLIGAYKEKNGAKWRASCNPTFEGNVRYLGSFNTELEAHKAWQAKKHVYACQLADLQEDPRVAQALRERYAPDKDWTKE